MRMRKKLHHPITSILMNKGLDKSLSTINCGTTKGNPKMAINAELPPALLAIAANMVNSNERLTPPVMTRSINFPICKQGLPNKPTNKK